MEQGDVAGGKAHLRVGRAVYDGSVGGGGVVYDGVGDGGVVYGGVVYDGGGVYSGRNLQELVLVFVVWCSWL